MRIQKEGIIKDILELTRFLPLATFEICDALSVEYPEHTVRDMVWTMVEMGLLEVTLHWKLKANES